MPARTAFRVPRLLLPRSGIALHQWAVVACDQYTAEPAYWESLHEQIGEAPSTLQLILPEAYLGLAQTPSRIRRIHDTMDRYLSDGVFRVHHGTVLVERGLAHGVRRGLMLELDLAHYDYAADSTSLIRPTEGTILQRLAPRIAVRAEATLEVPHVLVLIDDPGCTVIEPLVSALAPAPAPLYAGELNGGGGQLRGHAVPAAAQEAALAALAALGEPAAFAARHRLPGDCAPILFAVGDGNHSLASAKAIWDQTTAALSNAARAEHPARHALVEVVNLHDPALVFEPIHRLFFKLPPQTLRAALTEALGEDLRWQPLASAEALRSAVHCSAAPGAKAAFGLVTAHDSGDPYLLAEFQDFHPTLVVARLQAAIDALLGGTVEAGVDYIHGDDALLRLAAQPEHCGLLLPPLDKLGLIRRVALHGPLPRKAFSMGQAHEKRYYVEARRIRP